MNIESLRFFYLIANGHTFFEVAEEHHLSQSSVSKAIQRLESELDVVLFDRSARTVMLSPAGECLLHDLNEVIPGYRNMMQNIRAYQNARKISCCAVPSFSVFGLQYLLRLFNEQYPRIEIEQSRERDYRTALQHLSSGKVELVMMHRPISPHENCHFTYLHDDTLVAVLNESHPLAKEETLHFDQLSGENLLLDVYMSSMVIDAFSQFEVAPRISVSTMSREDVLGILSTEVGISLYYKSDIRAFHLNGVVVRRVEGFPDQPLVLGHAATLKLTNDHRLLRDYLVDAFSKEQD